MSNRETSNSGRAPLTLCVMADHEAMSCTAAELIVSALRANPHLILGAATGSTPTRTYELVLAAAAREPALVRDLRVFKVDEWGGLAADDPATCEVYLQQNIVQPLRISPDRFISWRSDAPNPVAECGRIAEWLDQHGPIDLCLLGLGANGHLAFIEPADELRHGPHVAELSSESLGHPMLNVSRGRPRHGLTLGIGDVMRSRQVLLLVSGRHKASQLQRLLFGGVSTRFPASLLSLHANATVICDSAAMAKLDD